MQTICSMPSAGRRYMTPYHQPISVTYSLILQSATDNIPGKILIPTVLILIIFPPFPKLLCQLTIFKSSLIKLMKKLRDETVSCMRKRRMSYHVVSLDSMILHVAPRMRRVRQWGPYLQFISSVTIMHTFQTTYMHRTIA